VATIVERQEGGTESLAKAGYVLEAIFTRAQLLQ
jgi:orotate phosphoribosyltransferase